MTNLFEKFWQITRSTAICIFLAFAIFSVIKGNAYNMEMEMTGPGSPADRLNESTRDRENREAADRVADGSKDQRDIDRANDFNRDHGA